MQAALIATAVSLISRSAVATWLSSSPRPCDFITRNNCSIVQRCLIPPDDLPGLGHIVDLMRGQQPPVQRLHPLGGFDLADLDQTQPHRLRQGAVLLIDRPGDRRPRRSGSPPAPCAPPDRAPAPAAQCCGPRHREPAAAVYSVVPSAPSPARRRSLITRFSTWNPPREGVPNWDRCRPRGRTPP